MLTLPGSAKMTLTLELPPDMERELHEEAAKHGQHAVDFTISLLRERLARSRQERASRIAALLDGWDAEDAAQPDDSPLPIIPPLSLREIALE